MNNSTKIGHSRRSFLKGIGAAGLGLALAPKSYGQAPAIIRKRPPNILLLTTDQWHADAFSYRGSPYVKTPHSDRIAAMGVDFERSYCPDPVCAPARTSWLTGRMPVEHGVIGNASPMESSMVDFGQWFGDHGYDTAMFGKWHTSGRNPSDCFDIYTGIHAAGQYGDLTIADTARAYLLNRRNDKPYFLHVSLMNPHDICQTSCLRTGDGIIPLPPGVELPPLPDNFTARPPEPEALVRNIRQSPRRIPERSWDETDWRMYRWMYYRNCEMVDAAIGKVLDALEASGEAGNTLLAYTSDHGDGLGHHAMTTKAFLYEEAARVPLILSMPDRLQAGTRDEVIPTSGIDLFPTFCNVAGIPSPEGFVGEDILAQHASGRSTRQALISSGSYGGWMAVNNTHKLIEYADSPTRQLFDLENDPGETTNVIDQTGVAGVLKELESELSAFQSRLVPSSNLSPQILRRSLPNYV